MVPNAFAARLLKTSSDASRATGGTTRAVLVAQERGGGELKSLANHAGAVSELAAKDALTTTPRRASVELVGKAAEYRFGWFDTAGGGELF